MSQVVQIKQYSHSAIFREHEKMTKSKRDAETRHSGPRVFI